jgi:choline dehydrogenase-like flavoprotein
MTWNRGCREDYDAWEALGNEGWGWESLLYVTLKAQIIKYLPTKIRQALFQEKRDFPSPN